MLAVIRRIKGKQVYFLDGKQVSQDVFNKATDPEVTLAEGISGKANKRRPKRGYPIKSVALAVSSKQVKEAQESSVRRGCPTEFTKGGRPIFTSASHMRKYLKAYGFHRRDGYMCT